MQFYDERKNSVTRRFRFHQLFHYYYNNLLTCHVIWSKWSKNHSIILYHKVLKQSFCILTYVGKVKHHSAKCLMTISMTATLNSIYSVFIIGIMPLAFVRNTLEIFREREKNSSQQKKKKSMFLTPVCYKPPHSLRQLIANYCDIPEHLTSYLSKLKLYLG